MSIDNDAAQASAPFIMYTTSWCGFCARLKHSLAAEEITYEEIDIERVPGAAQIVEQANRGNQTVPTLVFPDGTSMTNPSAAEVKAKLAG